MNTSPTVCGHQNHELQSWIAMHWLLAYSGIPSDDGDSDRGYEMDNPTANSRLKNPPPLSYEMVKNTAYRVGIMRELLSRARNSMFKWYLKYRYQSIFL